MKSTFNPSRWRKRALNGIQTTMKMRLMKIKWNKLFHKILICSIPLTRTNPCICLILWHLALMATRGDSSVPNALCTTSTITIQTWTRRKRSTWTNDMEQMSHRYFPTVSMIYMTPPIKMNYSHNLWSEINLYELCDIFQN